MIKSLKQFTKENPVKTSVAAISAGNYDDLISTIEEGYRKDNIPKFQKKKSFAPSTLVYNHGVCPRYWYLAFDGAEFYEYKPGKVIRNMDSGTDAHARIQTALEASGILLESEKKTVVDSPPIFGYVDAFINWKGEELVVEIKTCPDDAFKRHKEAGTASQYHILQLLIYMKIYRKNKGLVIYENKNTHELLVIEVVAGKEHKAFIDYLFSWMKEVYEAWENRTLPAVPFRSNTIKICQACPLQAKCQESPEGVIKIARRKDDKGEF